MGYLCYLLTYLLVGLVVSRSVGLLLCLFVSDVLNHGMLYYTARAVCMGEVTVRWCVLCLSVFMAYYGRHCLMNYAIMVR